MQLLIQRMGHRRGGQTACTSSLHKCTLKPGFTKVDTRCNLLTQLLHNPASCDFAASATARQGE
jgi:hypothetical protein